VHSILGIGELLWDMLPTGPQLGGAPANYSVMAGRLGNRAGIVSRIGDDDLGRKALALLAPFPVDCSLLQIDAVEPTGRVTVELASDGQPSYIIHQPVAWDCFAFTEPWANAVAQADAICFGSLAQRSAQSRQTIHALVSASRSECERIFDVNLRAPFYTAEILRESLKLATVVKMNDGEVPIVVNLLGLSTNPEIFLRAAADLLLAEFPSLRLAAITRGGSGSLLVAPSEWDEHPGIPTQVADTIGAGDAFTAAMTHYLLRGAPLATLNEAGNRWGSYIASRSGAMPELTEESVRTIAAEIEG
jgi:fructokinase